MLLVKFKTEDILAKRQALMINKENISVTEK